MVNKKPCIYTEMLRLRVEASDLQRLRELSVKRARPISVLLRKALRDFLQKELSQIAG